MWVIQLSLSGSQLSLLLGTMRLFFQDHIALNFTKRNGDAHFRVRTGHSESRQERDSLLACHFRFPLAFFVAPGFDFADFEPVVVFFKHCMSSNVSIRASRIASKSSGRHCSG